MLIAPIVLVANRPLLDPLDTSTTPPVWMVWISGRSSRLVTT